MNLINHVYQHLQKKLTLPRPVFPSKTLLYLNRCIGGETIYNKSVNDSRQDSSTLARQDEIYFPEYPWGDESWNQVVSHVKDMLDPFDIEVTENRSWHGNIVL